ncbi:glycosyltransferase family 2 protein, partial [uncultured Roseobacter sp.]|uniref:glycosyltransferase family 2 protein n=1 Tax=uncultured Roseobacter sp. TaxID=114847 RepID=UPI00260A9347
MAVVVSVIVPAHNEERKITRAIESIRLQQTSFEVEIIVVNDESTDNTKAIVDTLATEHDNIIVVHHDNVCGKCYSVSSPISMGHFSARFLELAGAC